MRSSSTGPRILFHKSRTNAYSLASLVGALEIAQGRTAVATPVAGPIELPDLAGWGIGWFGPAAPGKVPPPGQGPLTVLAYSFMTVDSAPVAASVGELRSLAPRDERWVFIAGGPHPSGDPEGTLAMGFDHVFTGEGEVTLCRFLDRLGRGEAAPPVVRPDHPTIDLDQFLSFAPGANLLAPIELGRGCPFACKFCHVPFFQGRRMRHRSVESVLEHVRIALRRGRTRTWFVTSDAFAYGSPHGEQGDPRTCERMLRGCREAGMEQVFWGGFPSEVRPDHVVPELLELVVRYCANRTVVIGAQSGSEEILRDIQRGHGAGVVRTATRLVRDFGLIPHVDFILGLPGETLDDRKRTLDLIGSITGDFGGRVHVHFFMPHPGTPFASSPPAAVEDEVFARIESLTGARKADGFWRRQRRIAVRPAPGGPTIQAVPGAPASTPSP